MEKIIKRTLNKLSINEIFTICIFVIMILTILINKLGMFETNGIVYFLKVFTISVCVISCIISYFIEKNITFYVVLIATYTLFLCGSILGDLVGLINFGQTGFFTGYIFDMKLQMQALIYIITGMIGLNLGYIIYSRFRIKNEKINNCVDKVINKTNKDFAIIGIIFIVMGIIPSVMNIFTRIKISNEFGYVALFNSELVESYKVPFSILIPFFLLGVYIVLATCTKKNVIKITIAIQVIMIILSVLTGERAVAFSQLLIIIIYIGIKLPTKIKLKYIVVMAIALVLTGQIISAKRVNIESDLNLFEKSVKFISDQGTSNQVIMYTIERENEFDVKTRSLYTISPMINMIKYNAISSKIFKPDKVYGRTEEYANTMYSLPHKISYIVNPGMYAIGNGLGGSYIAELFLLGGFFAVLFGSSILAIVVCILYSLCKSSKLILFVALNCVMYVFLAPRGSYLEFLPPMIESAVVYLCIYASYRGFDYCKIRYFKSVIGDLYE